jgi:hypothetical protein
MGVRPPYVVVHSSPWLLPQDAQLVTQLDKYHQSGRQAFIALSAKVGICTESIEFWRECSPLPASASRSMPPASWLREPQLQT